MTQYKYSIQIGDPSGDGHGQCQQFIIACDKTKEEILKAHDAFVSKYKISLLGGGPGITELFGEYEENELSQESLNRLRMAGIQSFPNGRCTLFEEGESSGISYDAEEMVRLFMQMVETQISITWHIIEFVELASFGYGAFSL